jgi:biotin synthase
MFNAAIVNMAEKVLANGDLSNDEALALIPGSAEAIMDLLTCADKIRRRFKQGQVFKCGIVNAKSGLCSEDCAFCAQSMHHHSGVEVYGMRSADQLIIGVGVGIGIGIER